MDLGLGRIGQIAMSAADIDASVKFYTEVMGLKIALRPQPGMVFFDCAGQYLLIEKQHGGEHYGTGAVLYFNVPDLAVCVKELKGRGATLKHEPHRIAQMPAYDLWMAFFEDPDKHLLALQMQAPKGYEWPK